MNKDLSPPPGKTLTAQTAKAMPNLDRIVHERARLVILAHLASSTQAETGFTELRDSLGFTPGNLSVQLKTLEEAGYVTTNKRFVDRKPFTGVSLTFAGKEALETYLKEVEQLIANLRRGNAPQA